MIIIKKKILLILAVILMGFGTLYRPALADSGWDSDYDSGGSWDSGSDWDSSSSWDSGSDWDSSSSWSSGGSSISGSGGGISLVAVIIVVVIIVVVVSKNGGNKGGGSSNISNSINGSNNISNYKDIDSEKIKSIDKDLNVSEFKTKVFRTYKDIQTAWMNFDTDTIRKLTTDEIYNMYSSQLETLKLKKQRNIMKDIELIDVKIIDIHKENDVITIDAYLNVKCYDYVIKDATGEVTRGTDKSKMNIKYSCLTEEDAYGIEYVAAHSWKETYTGLLPDEYLNNRIINIINKVERRKEFIRTYNGKYIGAKDKDKVIGILAISTPQEEKYKEYGHLEAIYVLKEYHGYGIGKELFKIAVNELKKMGFNKMQLECMEGNDTINFYKKYDGIVESQIDFPIKNVGIVKADIVLFEDLDKVNNLLNQKSNASEIKK